MGYKFITDEFDGEGTHGDYAYRWSLNGDGFVVSISSDGVWLVEWNSHPPLSPGILWAPIQMSKDVAGDVFVLLTDIADEIERRLEGAEGE